MKRILVALFALALGTAACGTVTTPSGGGSPAPGASESPGSPASATPSSEEIPDPGTAGGRFAGVSLVIAGPAGQLDFMKAKAQEWATTTGAQVRVDEIPFGDLGDKVLSAVSTGTYLADVINIGSNYGGDLMGGGFLLPVPGWAKQRVSWDGVLKIFREQSLSWGGVAYALPWDGDVLTYFYRKDAFAQYAAKYQQETGESLGPAASWQQYERIAKFFTGWDWNGDGQPDYGLVELPMRKNQGWNGFMTRAAAYAKAPDDPGFFFDPKTMEPRINDPGFVRALEDWKRAISYGPEGMLNFGWIENAQTFVGGKAAQDIQWGDIGPLSKDPSMSVVEGKVGYAMAPGADEYWDARTGQWVKPSEPNRAPFLGFGGWINVVPRTTRNAAAAFDLASFLGTPAILDVAVVTGGTGVNPSLDSQLKPEIWVSAGWPADEAREYVDSIRSALEHPNAVFDLRLPGFPEYKDAVELAVSEALSGQVSPQDALNKAADTWRQITDRLGKENQLRLYREALGLSAQ
jgi:multiple sugar transport system substrate-binding protein